MVATLQHLRKPTVNVLVDVFTGKFTVAETTAISVSFPVARGAQELTSAHVAMVASTVREPR